MKEASICKHYDALEMGLLPRDWNVQIEDVACRLSIETITDGRSVTSREDPTAAPVRVQVVTGDIIARELPWLHRLYDQEFREFASDFIGCTAFVAEDLQAGTNINLLSGEGARYERHVDSNPVTGLLFVNSLSESDGGRLVFEGNPDTVIVPRAGVFIAFDARQIVHHVTPLKGNLIRLTVPMNYYLSATDQVRPDDLNDYLYSPGKES